MLVAKNLVRARLWPRYRYQGGLAGATVRLPDNSIAVLAPGSYLGTERGFPKTTRTIYLFGDARFIVAHNQSIPFVVQTLGVGTRVLGTTFHLHADTMPQIRVDVTQGAVALETQDAAGHWRRVQVLTAGQAIQVPLLARWMGQAGYTVAGAGVPLREAARIEEALRRAVIRAGAAAAAAQARGDSTNR
jgi:hypothetical protein